MQYEQLRKTLLDEIKKLLLEDINDENLRLVTSLWRVVRDIDWITAKQSND